MKEALEICILIRWTSKALRSFTQHPILMSRKGLLNALEEPLLRWLAACVSPPTCLRNFSLKSSRQQCIYTIIARARRRSRRRLMVRKSIYRSRRRPMRSYIVRSCCLQTYGYIAAGHIFAIRRFCSLRSLTLAPGLDI